METLLKKEGELEYLLSDTFEGRMLAPLIQNLLWKAEHGWDDYDEVYHCNALIREVAVRPGMAMDFHLLRRRGAGEGLLLVTRGALELPLFFSDPSVVCDPAGSAAVLNYFHIAPAARGCGERWLTQVILPYYRKQGYGALYLKSSHPKAFSLYRRHGREVGAYRGISDNGLFEREGRIFRLPL